MEEKIYLDNNASTPIAPEVLEAVINIMKNNPGNASSVHRYGQQLKGKLSAARDTIARFLGVSPKELFFTSGATEALNTIIRGYLHGKSKGHIITSNVEHSCVMRSVEYLEKQGWKVTYLDAGEQGAPTAEAVKEAIRPDTQLITLMAVNNETGIKTDFYAIAEVAEEAGIPFVVDGVALLGKERFTIPQGVTAMGFSGHKVHAPQGVGVGFVRRKMKFDPLIVGGEHEDGRRAGTENLPGIIGFAKAVELLEEKLPDATEYMAALRDKLENGLKERLSDIKINGTGERICNTTNIAFTGIDGEALLAQLDMQGVAVSHGSACASGALEPSRVLLNMGVSRELTRSSLRFSVSRMTTEDEVERAIVIITDVVNRLRKIPSASGQSC